MKKIYQNARKVQVWLGSDDESFQAKTAIRSIETISDALYAELGLQNTESKAHEKRTYQELLLLHKDNLPTPQEIGIDQGSVYRALAWFYSHRYFTRIWVIQEISANEQREINVGAFKTTWDRLDLVASYLSIEPSLAALPEFANAHCWWVSTIAEITSLPDRWLSILYLASNYQCLDTRDVIYGLRGLMTLGTEEDLLDPNYEKSLIDVYRGAVEAALMHFQNTDVLLYAVGKANPAWPSWIPHWDKPMLFRNPFRFGNAAPFKPAGDALASWKMDKDANELGLKGFIAGRIEVVETYNQRWFADGILDVAGERSKLKLAWTKLLQNLSPAHQTPQLGEDTLTSMAVALSFGFGRILNETERLETLHSFVAYLLLVFEDNRGALERYIPPTLLQDVKASDGHVFGKPVWDFDYPDASIFITSRKMIGCAVSTANVGDNVFVPLGSAYPLVLEPHVEANGQSHGILGFSYVDGLMFGELAETEVTNVMIR
jgi:hypothetical protein